MFNFNLPKIEINFWSLSDLAKQLKAATPKSGLVENYSIFITSPIYVGESPMATLYPASSDTQYKYKGWDNIKTNAQNALSEALDLLKKEGRKMKIKKVTEREIVFSNGNTITYDHYPDCCEHNYADFPTAVTEHNVYYDYDFDVDLKFEFVDGEGFRFGSDGKWIFVPCYSEQNGYYSSDIQIYYNDREVLSGQCEYM